MLAFYSHTNPLVKTTFESGGAKEMPDLHYHHSYEIYLLIKGKKTYLIDDKLYEISEGDIILIPPMKLHKTLGKEEYSRYLITFSDNYLDAYFTEEAKKLLLECFSKRCIHLEGNVYQTVKHFAEKLIQTSKTNDAFHFAYLSNILAMLNECTQTADNIQPLTSSTNQTILSIVEYIDTHYKTLNSIEEIAEAHFVTKYHLCRMFKNATDVSLVKYINSVKVYKACTLLDNTSKNISEIAYETGFNSSMYFCRTFKSLTGLTPTEYKRRTYLKKKKKDDNVIII